MLRRFLVLGVGAFALVVVLGAPGQVHAQRSRGGFAHGVHPGFHGGFRPGFHRGGFGSPFGPGPRRIFDPRFNRGFNRGFDRFEDRFENRFNRGFFDPRFGRRFDRFEDRFGRGFFDPRFARDSAQASFVRFDGFSRETTA